MAAALAGRHMRRAGPAALALLVLLVSHTSSAERRNDLYFEVLGKGGLWGLGYVRHIAPRVQLGAVGSGVSLEGERAVTFNPYLGFYIVHHGRSAWFADLGAQFAHVWSVSPVPEWSGSSDSGVGGFLSTGYEFRSRVIVRVFVHGVAGKGGVLPWLGAGVGWAF